MAAEASMKEMTRICPWHLSQVDRAKPKTVLDSAAAALLFGIAILAIDRTITTWLERNFAFLLAF